MLLPPFYIEENWGQERLSGCQGCTSGKRYSIFGSKSWDSPALMHLFIVTSERRVRVRGAFLSPGISFPVLFCCFSFPRRWPWIPFQLYVARISGILTKWRGSRGSKAGPGDMEGCSGAELRGAEWNRAVHHVLWSCASRPLREEVKHASLFELHVIGSFRAGNTPSSPG